MSTNPLIKRTSMLPSFVDDFLKPWNDWFDNGFAKTLSFPAINISETDKQYDVSVAAPGMKKDDFKIDLDGNIITISAEKEETKEEKDKRYNRREYNYSSFSRSFTLPEEVKYEKIEAKYEDGVLNFVLPKSETAKVFAKRIPVK